MNTTHTNPLAMMAVAQDYKTSTSNAVYIPKVADHFPEKNIGENTNFTSSPQNLNDFLVILTENESVFGKTTENIIIILFTVLITFGSLGNGLVCFVVFRNAHMRTPRNIFIINLAISDLTLCLFTQPLNLYRLLYHHWHLGPFMCKFSAMLQGTNVFVSTISITAIALDRFQVIVYPTKDSMKKIGGAAALIIIWIISFLMASPLILFSVLEVKPIYELDFYYCFCLEDPTLRAEKGAYSVVSMVVQYILPIIIVTIAHARICNKLKYRMANRRLRRGSYYDTNNQTNGGRTRTNGNRSARKRRTNALLTLIAVVFVLSWLPLNISNILVEFQFELFRNQGIDINYVYLICHTLVLSSACSNPVLYGWLNDNFQKEFKKMFQCSCKTWLAGCIRRIRGKNTSTQSNTEQSECTHDARTRSRRFTNTSQMFMMTDFDQSCPQSVLSL